jgi:hypothetical protein
MQFVHANGAGDKQTVTAKQFRDVRSLLMSATSSDQYMSAAAAVQFS